MGDKKKVIIYQMGKVASSSIKTSLSQINKLDVIHTHHLSSGYIKELNDIRKTMGWETTITPDSVESLFSTIRDEDELIIISLVREPIGRNIAAYFQNLDAIHGQNNAHEKLSHNELLNGFLNNYPHSIPLTWFDKELKETLGIDIYKYEFPKKEGALIINEGRIHLLIMRYDIDDSVKQKYIENILNIRNIAIKCTNVGSEKSYSRVYKNFISNTCFSSLYLNEMLNSKYACHFFDNVDLRLLKDKWGKINR